MTVDQLIEKLKIYKMGRADTHGKHEIKVWLPGSRITLDEENSIFNTMAAPDVALIEGNLEEGSILS
jgi:hypothetical protein